MGSSNYVPFLLVTTTVTAAAISSTEIGFILLLCTVLFALAEAPNGSADVKNVGVLSSTCPLCLGPSYFYRAPSLRLTMAVRLPEPLSAIPKRLAN